MKHFNRIVAAVLAFMVLFVGVPAMAQEETEAIRETTAVYFCNSTSVGSIETVYFSQEKDIPYISLSTTARILRTLADMFHDEDYQITDGMFTYAELVAAGMLTLGEDMDPDTSVYVLERENGSFVLFDAESSLIWMSDRDKFFVSSYAVTGGDLVSSNGLYYLNEDRTETAVNLYRRANGNQFVREGDVTSVFLDDYDISIRVLDGEMYLPVATVSDLILPVPMTFNGEALFLTNGGLDNNSENAAGETQYELYYRPGARERSEELIVFNYNELCLMLDLCYGLQSEHGITTGFNDYFIATGLSAKLLSDDISVYTEGLNQLLTGYFGDLHSGMTSYSPYTGGEISLEGKNTSISLSDFRERLQRFAAAREAAGITVNGQIINGYTEIGDTAFITFDSFVGASQDYYSQELWQNFGDIYMSDTVSLVIWAQTMIHRENSPIRNVVIDLSCNGGGSVNACVYVAAWVLGAAAVSIENVNTGARYTTNYWVDTNLDGKCTSSDDLGVDDLNVYCLISGNSFSCGNLLPALFKQDGRVTLVGQTSGGGSCLVHETSAADGTLFSISSYLRLSMVKNGSFYSIDTGVEPDIPLRKCEAYYDREALVEYLKTFR